MTERGVEREVAIPVGPLTLGGHLAVPGAANAIVVFVHGSGSSRFSPRNRYVAGVLVECGLGVLLLDLLSPEEEQIDRRSRALRFDIPILAERVLNVLSWLHSSDETAALKPGLFGSSTGAAAALTVAARRPGLVGAVVSRGGRVDLAGQALPSVTAPVLMIVGGEDRAVLALNEAALDDLACERRLEIVPGAGHLFEEPGALEQVAVLAREWFRRHLGQSDA
jgi:dienelactone hydrolase